MKKNDIILIIIVVVLAGLFFGAQTLQKQTGGTVQVYVDGTLTAEYPLSEERTVTVKGYRGGTNSLHIQDGKADMTEADCPDGLCVKQAAIYRNGESIICLPHRVVVTIANTTKKSQDIQKENENLLPAVDAVAN